MAGIGSAGIAKLRLKNNNWNVVNKQLNADGGPTKQLLQKLVDEIHAAAVQRTEADGRPDLAAQYQKNVADRTQWKTKVPAGFVWTPALAYEMKHNHLKGAFDDQQ